MSLLGKFNASTSVSNKNANIKGITFSSNNITVTKPTGYILINPQKTGVNATTSSLALSNPSYFSITILPKTAYYYNLNSISISVSTTANVSSGFIIRSNYDNYTNNLYTTSSITTTSQDISIDTSQLPYFTSPLILRFYVYSLSTTIKFTQISLYGYTTLGNFPQITYPKKRQLSNSLVIVITDSLTDYNSIYNLLAKYIITFIKSSNLNFNLIYSLQAKKINTIDTIEFYLTISGNNVVFFDNLPLFNSTDISTNPIDSYSINVQRLLQLISIFEVKTIRFLCSGNTSITSISGWTNYLNILTTKGNVTVYTSDMITNLLLIERQGNNSNILTSYSNNNTVSLIYDYTTTSNSLTTLISYLSSINRIGICFMHPKCGASPIIPARLVRFINKSSLFSSTDLTSSSLDTCSTNFKWLINTIGTTVKNIDFISCNLKSDSYSNYKTYFNKLNIYSGVTVNASSSIVGNTWVQDVSTNNYGSWQLQNVSNNINTTNIAVTYFSGTPNTGSTNNGTGIYTYNRLFGDSLSSSVQYRINYENDVYVLLTIDINNYYNVDISIGTAITSSNCSWLIDFEIYYKNTQLYNSINQLNGFFLASKSSSIYPFNGSSLNDLTLDPGIKIWTIDNNVSSSGNNLLSISSLSFTDLNVVNINFNHPSLLQNYKLIYSSNLYILLTLDVNNFYDANRNGNFGQVNPPVWLYNFELYYNDNLSYSLLDLNGTNYGIYLDSNTSFPFNDPNNLIASPGIGFWTSDGNVSSSTYNQLSISSESYTLQSILLNNPSSYVTFRIDYQQSDATAYILLTIDVNNFTSTSGEGAPPNWLTSFELYYSDVLQYTLTDLIDNGSINLGSENNYPFNDPISLTANPGLQIYIGTDILSNDLNLLTINSLSEIDSNYIDMPISLISIIQTEYPCFKDGTKILTENGYMPIENLKIGDMIKTIKHGYVPISLIGKSQIYNRGLDRRIPDQLYLCNQDNYPEIFEDLIITGAHSILVNNFINEKQRNKTRDINKDLYITDNKYRLPACVDDRAVVYNIKGNHMIYHIALENDNYYGNYGIYANGLLVESCSNRYLKELSNMLIS